MEIPNIKQIFVKQLFNHLFHNVEKWPNIL